MIKKLRTRFILISMLSIFAVIVVIMSSIFCINYVNMKNDADDKITLIKENFEKKAPNDPSANKEDNKFDFDKGTGRELSEARYFVVTIDESGEYKTQNSTFNSIDDDAAITLAKTVLSKSKNKGSYDDYRYRVYENESLVIKRPQDENTPPTSLSSSEESDSTNSQTYTFIILLDISSEVSSLHSFIITCIIISVIGMIAFFLLVFFFSIKVFKPVKKSYEKQKRFITNASHELKTPLTIISANNEVLALEYEDNEYSKSIDKQIKRMTSMVNNLTMLARLDEIDKIENTNCNLTSLCYEAIDTYTPVFISSNKKFTFQIAEGVYLVCDIKLISQLVALLLDNAFKYSLTYVKMDLIKNPKEIVFSIENDAFIEEKDENLYLERFYRSNSARNTKEGSGIGLSLVKEIVDLHKANIDIKAINNTFKISIKFKI